MLQFGRQVVGPGLEQLFVKFKSEWGHFRVSRALNAVSSNGVFGTNRDHFLRCRDLPLGFRYSGCARARAENRRRCLLRGLPGVLPSAAARGPKFAPVPRMCARKPGPELALHRWALPIVGGAQATMLVPSGTAISDRESRRQRKSVDCVCVINSLSCLNEKNGRKYGRKYKK